MVISQLSTHHCCISAVPTIVTDCSPQAFNTDLHPAFSSTTPQLNMTISAFISSCWKKWKSIRSPLTHSLDICVIVTFDYLCISLQHHRYDHSLSYTDLLQNWSNLTVLILLLYMPHCPTVWIQFHIQSNYSSKQLHLYHTNIHNCKHAVSDWDVAM